VIENVGIGLAVATVAVALAVVAAFVAALLGHLIVWAWVATA
jgi:hypothetical protein